MKRIEFREIIKTEMGGEYLFDLSIGDVFVSFHLNNAKCFGFSLKKEEVNKKTLELMFIDFLGFVSIDHIFQAEIKMIGHKSSLKILGEFYLAKKILQIKKIEKEFATQVIFLPALGKVRVSIDGVVSKNEIQQDASELKVTNIFPRRYKILIVDDSKTIRNILSKIFSSDPLFEVCAMAEKPSEVEALIIKHKPDVITMDIHMPEMDGVTLLKIISPKYHIPTVMISSISMAEGPLVLEALENGAVDYIQKPEMSELENVTPLILDKVKTAAQANISKASRNKKSRPTQVNMACDVNSLIVLGSSTGGTEAIREIITALPNKIPPMLIVQHIPAVFSAAFASRMNDLCAFDVKEAEHDDEVIANRILIAPGGKQMRLIHKNGKTFVEITEDEPVNRFKPSVDYLFFSVARNLYTHTIAVILTGMGKDGAKGMLELRKSGVRTIAQDEYSSVVFGMPKEAIANGGAEYIEPLSQIAERITLLTKEKSQIKKIS